jgi:hypothetical protein
LYYNTRKPPNRCGGHGTKRSYSLITNHDDEEGSHSKGERRWLQEIHLDTRSTLTVSI